MKILVTGATGFLGGHVVESLAGAGHSVRALVRRTSRTDLLDRLGVEKVLGEMKDAESLRKAVEGMDAVAHVASTMGGPVEEYVAATIDGTQNLLNAASAAGVKRFVHVSSIGVHSLFAGRTITEETPYENDPELIGSYTSSKIAAEKMALKAADSSKMEVVVIRPGIIYGPRGNWNISRLGFAVGANWQITVGLGRIPLPVVYVKNCAAAIKTALTRQKIPSGMTFNVIDDERFTARQYLKRLRVVVRPKMKIVPVPYFMLAGVAGLLRFLNKKFPKVPRVVHRAHISGCHRRLYYSNERAKRDLGWTPDYGKEQALAETMLYFSTRETLSRRADIKSLRAKVHSEDRLNVAVIGGGEIADSHVKILEGMDNVRVVAVCDMNIAAARKLCDKYRILYAYDDPAEMLKKERPDVVHILTPPQSHAKLAELAFSHECHVLVEKPMALDAAEAAQMVKQAAEKGVRLCVDHNHLYDPIMVRARKIIESGALGQPVWVESYYGFDLGNNPRSRYMLPGGDKHWTFKLPGGLYQNIAPHPLSLALEFMGKPTAIRAIARYGRVLPHQETDELRVFIESDKCPGMVTVSIAASPRSQFFNVYGVKGTLYVDLMNKWLYLQKQHKGVPKPISRALMNLSHGWAVLWGTTTGMFKIALKKWTPYDGMGVLVREFYASLLERRDPPVSGEEGLAVMDAMDEIWRQIGMGMSSEPSE